MIKQDQNNTLIAKNTLLLYFRMLITMGVSIYTSRITLNALGVVDYGIYNVIGGVIATFGFLNTTLSTSTTRFITFELGKHNFQNLRTIFSNISAAHWLLAITVFILGESIGVWFLNTYIVLPENRLFAANIVFQCALGSFIMEILSVPYNGLIIAHEKMNAFAYISILEVILKLICVWSLLFFNTDKLILYACFWLAISILIRSIYNIYCFRRFEESRTRPSINKKQFKQILSFSGYNLCEVFANMLADQGVNILLNIHFGPVVNAARGIAMQVNGALNGFTHNFTIALNPQIIKEYAQGGYTRMLTLIGQGGKFSFYLLLLLATPIFFMSDYILLIWLKTPPEYSSEFLKLLILTNLCIMPTGTFYTAISATGDIKQYQICFGIFRLTVFPVCWFILNFIYSSPIVIYEIFVCYEIIGTIVKLLLLRRRLTFFNIMNYCKNIIVPCIICFTCIFIINFYVVQWFSHSIIGLLEFAFLCELINITIIYSFGITHSERNKILKIITQTIRKCI